MKYLLENKFHDTCATIIFKDGRANKRSVRRAEKKLCGISGCKCGGIHAPENIQPTEDGGLSIDPPTVEKLNANDNPKYFGGELLSDDGQGNQLWSFPGGGCATRHLFWDPPGMSIWSDCVSPWGVPDESALH